MAPSNKCAVCMEDASQSCSACSSVYYCSKDHQKQDWKSHKTSCAPYKIEVDDTFGRYLTASRDIDQGEVIMRKLPLILGPKMVSAPICLGCHKKLNLAQERYSCSKCEWPLCSSQCETSPLHSECEIFAKSTFKPHIENSCAKQTAYSSIVPLRALLLKFQDPKKYQTLNTCQSHLKDHMETTVYKILRQTLVPLFVQRLGLDFTEEEIMNTCSIFDTNSFEVRDTDGLVNIRGLYPTMTLLAHDCKHNTKHSFHGDGFELVLTATVPIKKGEQITTTYTQTLWGTLARRAHLKRSKNFDCTCARCKDPREFGTYAGAIYCTECRNNDDDNNGDSPKLVSSDPLDNEAMWQCESCGNEVEGSQVSYGNELLKREIAMLDKTGPEALEGFLKEFEGALHPKNSVFLEVKYALSQMYGNMPGYKLDELPLESLDRKIQLCHELIAIADVLEPGYSRFRGSLFYDLQATMVAKAKREFAKGQISKEDAESLLAKASDCLDEAAKILSSEPDLKEIVCHRVNHSKLIFSLSS